MPKKVMSAALSEDIKRKLEKRANLEHRSFSNMIEHIVTDYLKREEKKQELFDEWEKEREEEREEEKEPIIAAKEQFLAESEEDTKNPPEEKEEAPQDSILNHMKHNFGIRAGLKPERKTI